jgi:hypothetical protein
VYFDIYEYIKEIEETPMIQRMFVTVIKFPESGNIGSDFQDHEVGDNRNSR